MIRRWLALGTVLLIILLQGCDVTRDIVEALVALCDHPHVVTKFQDTRDGRCTSDDCSLYDAVVVAEFCGQGTIRLSPGEYSLEQIDSRYFGPTALPLIRGDLTIEGNGATIQRSADKGISKFRMFHVGITGMLTLVDLTLRNGFARRRDEGDVRPFDQPANHGGAIFNVGTLTLRNTRFSENRATTAGGAIYNLGILTVAGGSSFDGNRANAGGGIFTGDAATRDTLLDGIAPREVTATITATTFSSNQQIGTSLGIGWYVGGGAIYNFGGRLTVQEVTFRQNSSQAVGGGIYNTGTLSIVQTTFDRNTAELEGGAIRTGPGSMTMSSSTVSGNTAALGGGIYCSDGMVTLQDCTIAGNSATRAATAGGGLNISGPVTLQIGNTLVADSPSGNDCGLAVPVEQTSVNLSTDDTCGFALRGDPRLDPLANYGGRTETHRLAAGSPAINAGERCGSTDQRGRPRPAPSGGRCDIGAFEVQ